MIRISNIKIPISEVPDDQSEKLALQNKILHRLRIREDALKHFEISKKSIDARKKDEIIYVYAVDVEVQNESRYLSQGDSKDILPTPDLSYQRVQSGNVMMKERPVIIGMGPAGLFAGLMLSRYGYRPILLERGEDVDSRTASIKAFWHNGSLNTESNVQFGEGGAGTFSDGKLTTLINDKRCHTILKEFIKAGAPEEIQYTSKPHIGTDGAKSVVKILAGNFAQGGEVRLSGEGNRLCYKGRGNNCCCYQRTEYPCSVVLLDRPQCRIPSIHFTAEGYDESRKSFSTEYA